MGRKKKNKKSEADGSTEGQPKGNTQEQQQQPGSSQSRQSQLQHGNDGTTSTVTENVTKDSQRQAQQKKQTRPTQTQPQQERPQQQQPQPRQERFQQQQTRPQQERPQQQQPQPRQERFQQQQTRPQQERPQQQQPQPRQERFQQQQTRPQQERPQQQQPQKQKEGSQQHQERPQQQQFQPQQERSQQPQSRPQQKRSQQQQQERPRQQQHPQQQLRSQQQQSGSQDQRSQYQQVQPQQERLQYQQRPQQQQQTWPRQQQHSQQQHTMPQRHQYPQQQGRSEQQQSGSQHQLSKYQQVQPQQERSQYQQRPQQQQQQTRSQYQQGSQPQEQSPLHEPPYTPSRQSNISHSSSSSSVSSAVSQNSIPPGTLGTKGECESNYLLMDLSKMPNKAYHYDVTITPDRPKKFFRNAFTQFLNTFLPGHFAGFDGVKSCYMLEKLPNPVYEGDVMITDSGSRQIQFKVSIKPTDSIEVDLGSLRTYRNERIYDKPMRALQCLEVVLSNACQQKSLRVGRSFFTRPNNTLDLDGGFELYTGLYQAAILGDQPYLNVDISNKSFPMALSLLDFLSKVKGVSLDRGLDQRSYQSLSAHIRALKIVYTPPASFGATPRSYKVNDVSRESANSLSFTIDTGEKLTVERYFASRGYRLKYPHLNCVVAGSSVKPNYLPIELCSIEPGQAIKRKDGAEQVRKMIRFAATSTDERKRKIMEKLQYFMHNNDVLLQKFGIVIGNQFIKVPTRLLKAPSIEYRLGRLVDPRNGSWRNLEYLQTGVALKKTGYKWAIIYTQSRFLRYDTLQQFSEKLLKGAKNMNINLDSEREVQETRDIVRTLEEYKRKDYDLVVVVIPNYGTTYADIKQKAELVCGLLTQCIKESTVSRRLDDQLISNLLLKINSKLNGSNHKISAKSHIVLDHPMFMGADVTHPSPDQRNIPSVVGVAASHDLNGASYNMQYRLQESTKEEIDDMQSISRHHLNVYHQKHKCYPKNIIYYRDGVSDGQFKKVNNFEVNAIRAVCKELKISPKITCIIVVKRHHTRFFPTKPTGDKFNNVLPGTVVDQKIVHPNETQFFMVSHQSIQGTAKPTRYNVLVDDAKFSMDELQMMTNNLCYMFPRCNRAVSYPAPAYLAHLVAARGRVYIDGPPLRRALREEYNRRLINETFMQNTPMFFV